MLGRRSVRGDARGGAGAGAGAAGAVGLSVGTAERLPYRAESFDLVFSVDVIHHVGDPLRSMHEASRVLVPGGRVCVATEDAEMIRARLHSRYFPETLDVELARYPTVADLRTWLAGAGFAEVREERTVTPVRVVDSSAHRDRAFSSLHLISDAAHRRGLERLDLDLARGPIVWPAEQLLVWAVKPSG